MTLTHMKFSSHINLYHLKAIRNIRALKILTGIFLYLFFISLDLNTFKRQGHVAFDLTLDSGSPQLRWSSKLIKTAIITCLK